jgi:hypothetical protein
MTQRLVTILSPASGKGVEALRDGKGLPGTQTGVIFRIP